VVLAYGILTAAALLAFSMCPNQPLVQWASIALVGFGLYGPQMLIGLCGAEVGCSAIQHCTCFCAAQRLCLFFQRHAFRSQVNSKIWSLLPVPFLTSLLVCLQVVRPDAVGAAQGLLGWVSYMGAACAGAPLAFAVQKLGWNTYFLAMIIAAGIASALVVPMLNLKSYSQRVAEEAS
jgi:MFS transporter, OPA family, sugar phosphate sensor protein UhpC